MIIKLKPKVNPRLLALLLGSIEVTLNSFRNPHFFIS